MSARALTIIDCHAPFDQGLSNVSIVGIAIIVSSVKHCKYCFQVHEKLLKLCN